MESELLNPLVPVALIELCAICRMSEQSRPLTHLRPEGLVEGPEAAGAELLPGPGVPVVLSRGEFPQDGRPGLGWPGDGGDSLAKLLPSPALLVSTASWLSRKSIGSRRSAHTSVGASTAIERSASIITISRSCSSIRPPSIGVS